MESLKQVLDKLETMGYSHAAAAREIGTEPQTVSNALRGRRSINASHVGKLAELAGMPPWETIGAYQTEWQKLKEEKRRRFYVTAYVSNTIKAVRVRLGDALTPCKSSRAKRLGQLRFA